MTTTEQLNAAIDRQINYTRKINVALNYADPRDVEATIRLRRESTEAKSVLARLLRTRQELMSVDDQSSSLRSTSIFIGSGS